MKDVKVIMNYIWLQYHVHVRRTTNNLQQFVFCKDMLTITVSKIKITVNHVLSTFYEYFFLLVVICVS